MKLKTILTVILSLLIFTSCATMISSLNADKRMKDVRIGMTQDEVIQIMGNSYQVIGSKQNEVILGYEIISESIYRLVFIDGVLTEWTKEWLPKQDSHNHFMNK